MTTNTATAADVIKAYCRSNQLGIDNGQGGVTALTLAQRTDLATNMINAMNANPGNPVPAGATAASTWADGHGMPLTSTQANEMSQAVHDAP